MYIQYPETSEVKNAQLLLMKSSILVLIAEFIL